MAKLTTKQIVLLCEALAKHEASTKRLLANVKSPEIKKCYEQQLVDIQQMTDLIDKGQLSL